MLDFVVKYWLEVAFGLVVAILTGLYRKLSKQVKEEQEKDSSDAIFISFIL